MIPSPRPNDFLLAAVGLLRMPDAYMRMQAASKASTLGTALVVASAAAGLGDGPAVVRAAVAILFLCITMPVAAHLLGRAAARTGVPFSGETRPVEFPGADRAPEDTAGTD
ncbi:MAG: monovalent cation/H(+) antiporter subunit G [Planctomycetota bacterium]